MIPIDAPARRRLPPLLRKAWYSLNQAFRRRIAYSALTPDQFTILRQIIEAPREGLTQRQISSLMSSDPNTVTSLLNRMQDAGLLERKPHESDKRAHRVRLLPKGKRIYRELRQVALDLQSHVLEALPEERREQFLEDLERVAEKCLQSAAKPSAHDAERLNG